MYVCTPCVFLASEVRKWGWDHLQLELWMVVSYHVGTGTKPRPLQEQKML